jgi:hypothetical protein
MKAHTYYITRLVSFSLAVLFTLLFAPFASTSTQAAECISGRFDIVAGGKVLASFTQMSDLTSATAPLRLWRARSSDPTLQEWHDQVVQGNESARRDVWLMAYQQSGALVGQHELKSAWPSEIVVQGSAVEYEEVSFTFQR